MSIAFKRFLKITFWLLFIALDVVGLMALNNSIAHGQYTVDTEAAQTVIVSGDSFEFGNIKIVDNRVFGLVETTLTEDMIVSIEDTSEAGQKKVVFEHNNKQFTVIFEVKYKVEFLSYGEVIDTQLVVKADELKMPTPKPKDHYDFAGWDYDFSKGISDNIQVNAVFDDIEYPELLPLTATYGDTLGDIALPSNDRGRWEFVYPTETPVGDAGHQTYSVRFVFNESEGKDYYKFDTAEISVAKKTLGFTVDTESFVYDGKAHFPTYSLSEKVNVVTGGNEATVPGTYEYSFIIEDANYCGEYSSTFEITRPTVTVTVSSAEITYPAGVPEFTFTVDGFDNTDNILGIEVVAPKFAAAGTYEIGITYTNTNVDYIINKGTLTVLKGDQTVPTPGYTTPTYGDKLSDIEFVGNYQGTWTWDDPDTVIDTMNGVTAWATFKHADESYNDYRVEITVTGIQKKVLVINILAYAYVCTPDVEYTLPYELIGVCDFDEADSVILKGNAPESRAGTHDRYLYIEDPRYSGSLNTELKISKAIPVTDFSTVYEKTWTEGLTLGDILLPEGYAWVNPDYVITAGTHYCEAIYTPSNTNDYETVTDKFTVNVAKADVIIEGVEDSYDKTYDTQKIDIKNSDITAKYTDGTLTITYYKDGVEVDEIKHAGTYTVVITVSEGTNYRTFTDDFEVVISPDVNTETVKTSQTAYVDDPLTVLELPEGVEGTWSWKEAEIGGFGTKTFTAVFTPDANGNYEEREVSVTVTVKKIPFSVDNIDDKPFTGEEYDTGYTDTEIYTVTGDIKATDAGNYSVTFTLRNPDKYEWIGYESSVSITKTYNVSKALNTWDVKPENKTAVYDGNPVYINAKGTHGETKVVYTLNGVVVDHPTKVGVYVATVTVTDDNYDMSPTEVTLTITEATVIAPTKIYNSPVYNKTAQGITFEDPYEKLDVLYEIDSEIKGTNAGDNLVLVLKLKDSHNYKWDTTTDDTVTYTGAIVKHTVQFKNETSIDKSTWTYSDAEGVVTKATLDDASVSYGVPTRLLYSYNGGAFVTYDQLAKTDGKLNAGTYTVKTVVDSTVNWDKVETAAITFSVGKASLEINPNWVNPVTDVDKAGNVCYYLNTLKLGEYVITFKGTPFTATVTTHGVATFDGANTVYKFNLALSAADAVNYSSEILMAVPMITVATIGHNGTPYGSIESALEAANAKGSGVIWVIPNTSGNVKIFGEVVIGSGVTLRLPYGSGSGDYNSSNKTDLEQSGGEFDVQAEANPDKYEMLKVIIASGAKLTVESGAKLDIAGKIYAGGGFAINYCGHTAADYAVLLMEADSTLEIKGEVNLNGYIREVSEDNGSLIVIKNGGLLDQPYVLRDFRSGNYLSVAKDSSANEPEKVYTPFARFTLMNASPLTRIEKGAKIQGHVNISSTLGIMGTTGLVVSDTTDSLIQITTGYMDFRYDVDDDVMRMHFYGGASLNEFIIKITLGSVSTKDYPFAFSCHMDITLDKLPDQSEAVYTLGKDKEQFKMMPGAKLTVEPGATLYVTKLNIYNGDFVDDILCSTEENPNEGTYVIPYPSGVGDAILTVRGKLIAGAIGGKVHTDGPGASIKVTNATTVSNSEINRFTASYFDSKVFRDTMITNSLELYYNGALVKNNIMLNVEYVSGDNNWNFDISLLDTIEIKLQNGYGVYTENALLTDEFGGYYIGAYDSRETKVNVAILTVVKGNDVTFYLTKNQLFVMGAATSSTVDLTHPIVSCTDKYEYVVAPSESFEPAVYYVPSFNISTSIAGKVTYSNLNANDTADNITSSALIEITVSNKVHLDGTLSLTVENIDPSKVAFSYTGKSGSDSGDGTYTITGNDKSGTNVSVTAKITITSNHAQTINVTSEYVKGETSCITPDTLITLADGTQVRVDELKGDELLLVWNLETGRFDVAPIMFVDSEDMAEYQIIHLYFSDGTVVKVIYEHGFWDYDLNRYVYLDKNASDYIGHYFAKQNGDELVKVQLVDVEIKTEMTTAWSPVTVGHLCYFVNGMLSMPGGVGGLFNIFEVDADTMTYDIEAMERDIAEYGLYTYEELNAICPLSEDMFYAAGGAYLKISIGKGNLTVEELIYMIERYSKFV